MAKGYLYDNGDELISREDALPSTAESSPGDILSLNDDKEAEWVTPESELPSTGSASAGDVLSLDSDKKPVWSAPSGGGGHGANFVFYNVYTLNSDDRVYFFYADGTPCQINDLIASWDGVPMFFTNNDTEVSIASWDDVAFVGPTGEAKGFMIYEDNDALKVFIDSAELSLEASSNNYIAVPK